MIKNPSVHALLVILLLAVPRPAAALPEETSRDVAPAEGGDFGEVVEVNVVNVDVTVLDRKGHPVTDLVASDFEVFEDGRLVEVSHFSLVSQQPLLAQEPVEAPSMPTAGEDPAGLDLGLLHAQPAMRSSRPGGSQPLWLAIYVDNLHSRLFERNRSLDRIAQLLGDRPLAGTQIMLASYDRSLKTRQAFTDDSSLVLGALKDLKGARAEGDRNDDEQRRLIKAIERSVSPKDALETVRPFANQARGELWGSLEAVEEMVDRLAGLPGRKAILFVSGGLPLKPGAGLFNVIEYKWPGLLGIHEMMLFDQSQEFEQLGRLASESGVTIHTLDIAGVRPARSSGVEEELKLVPAVSANFDADVRTNLQLPLRQLADATGGRAILNRNNALPELRELAVELGTYYSLGYLPQRPADDRFHRIEVRVQRKNVRLHHREGYRDKAAGLRMTERLRAALAHGVAENRLQVAFEVGRSEGDQPSGKGVAVRVPVQVRVPLDRVALLPEGNRYRGQLRLYLAAMDQSGGMSPVLEIPVDLDIAGDEVVRARASWWQLSQPLDLRSGSQRLALGVRDELGLTTAFVTLDIEAGGS